jgi:hypothetical protein
MGDALARWEGKRPLILCPDHEPPAAQQPVVTDPLAVGPRLLDLELLHLGTPVKTFAAEADPGDAAQLGRLLKSAVRRHTAGDDTDLGDFELTVRQSGDPEVITVFASL